MSRERMSLASAITLLLAFGAAAGSGPIGSGKAQGAQSGALHGSCGSLVSGALIGRLRVDRLLRRYFVHVPDTLSRKRRHPLVLVFHGPQESAKDIAVESEMSALAGRHGFIAAYPSAYTTSLSPTASWLPESYSPVDMDFAARLIDTLSKTLCIDQSRIYATGFSAGGTLAYDLACHLSGKIAAVGAVAGLSLVEPDNRRCRPRRWASMITFQGSESTAFGRGSGADWTRRWAADAGCNHIPETLWVKKDVKAVAFTHCRGTTAVQLYTIRGGGLTWPGSPVFIAHPERGPVTHTVRASDIIWQFFNAHPLASSRLSRARHPAESRASD